ncbi:MAG: hypothetical protein K0R20_2592 [Actinomycetia bacterium]|nr:hypothetical protein [Actinomycetes bacterium]
MSTSTVPVVEGCDPSLGVARPSVEVDPSPPQRSAMIGGRP